MQRRINVRGIIINDKGELFCQRLKANEQNNRNFWCTPGGGLDLGEGLLDSLHREMVEETGVAPKTGKLLFIQQYAESGELSAHGPGEQLEFFFHITNWQDYEVIDLVNTSHGEIEVGECGFVDPKNTYILPQCLSEVDFDWLTSETTPVQLLSENL